MGPCTSTSKSHQKRSNESKSTPAEAQPQNPKSPQEVRGNTGRTASTDEKHASIDPKPAARNEDKNNENCEGDHTLQITPASQKCLRNVQNKKFLSSINNNDSKTNSEQVIKASNSMPIKGRRMSGEESDGINLVSKRPNFQKQIEKKKIDLKINLKSKHQKKTT